MAEKEINFCLIFDLNENFKICFRYYLTFRCEMVNFIKKDIFFSIQGISSLHQCSTSLQAKTFVHYMTLLAEIKHLLGDTLLCHHDSGSAVTCCVLMCTWQKMAYFKGSHTSAVFVQIILPSCVSSYEALLLAFNI